MSGELKNQKLSLPHESSENPNCYIHFSDGKNITVTLKEGIIVNDLLKDVASYHGVDNQVWNNTIWFIRYELLTHIWVSKLMLELSQSKWGALWRWEWDRIPALSNNLKPFLMNPISEINFRMLIGCSLARILQKKWQWRRIVWYSRANTSKQKWEWHSGSIFWNYNDE